VLLALSTCITDSRRCANQEPDSARLPSSAPVEAKTESSKKGTAKKAVKKPSPPPAPRWAHWSGNRVDLALKLLVYVDQGMKAEAQAAMQALLQQRNARGEWGNTFTNAWTLYAMSAYERSLKNTAAPLAVTAGWVSK